MGMIDKILEKASSISSLVNLKQVYLWFPEEKTNNLRWEIQKMLVGRECFRIGRGEYLFFNPSGAGMGFFKNADAISEVKRLIRAKVKFDTIFLDPPYHGAGQRGGRRTINDFPLIPLDYWVEFVSLLKHLLRDEDSQIYLMATNGRASRKTVSTYIKAVDDVFRRVDDGTYEKLDYSGRPTKFGQYDMPPELLNLYSISGNPRICSDDFRLNFSEIRPYGKYPTQKPHPLVHQIVKQSTTAGMSCLDPFAGSGVFQRACLDQRRFCYSIDLVSQPERTMIF